MNIKKYGLDFGTTNSAIAIEENGVGKVLVVDTQAVDPRVIRTLLYALKRELYISPEVPEKRLNMQIFKKEEIEYRGNQQFEVGQDAVSRYISENKFRHFGIRRKILTGRWIIPAVSASSDQGRVDPVPEYYEDIDYGVGRLMQALKTALKSRLYQGTSVFGQFYSLEELIAEFLKVIKAQADLQVGGKITHVTCGRPVHFLDDPEKDKAAQDRLEEALRLAGFEQIEFVYEPIAAAKQFIAELKKSVIPTNVEGSIVKPVDEGDLTQIPRLPSVARNDIKTVLVFDFGGGTLDTAIVDVESEKVLASDGVYIGGDLLNADIMEHKLWRYFGYESSYGDHQQQIPRHFFENLRSWFSIPNLNNPEMMAQFEKLRYKNSEPQALDRFKHLITANLGFDIYESIENAKKQLSKSQSADIIFRNGPIDIDEVVTREEFENIIASRVEEIREVLMRTLQTAKVEPEQIDVVVRTGGSSLIPVFENMLIEIFGKSKIQQFETFTSIASGLAL